MVERWAENPEVVSSILTLDMLFWSFIFFVSANYNTKFPFFVIFYDKFINLYFYIFILVGFFLYYFYINIVWEPKEIGAGLLNYFNLVFFLKSGKILIFFLEKQSKLLYWLLKAKLSYFFFFISLFFLRFLSMFIFWRPIFRKISYFGLYCSSRLKFNILRNDL